MKLILCVNCQDVYKLIREQVRSCKCGKTHGHYLDDGLNAVVSDNEDTYVLGFHNGHLFSALQDQFNLGDQSDGMGRRFTAFIIPSSAPTVQRKESIA